MPRHSPVHLRPTLTTLDFLKHVRSAVQRLDRGGCFDRADVAELRALASTPEPVRVTTPADLFGPWHALPEAARAGLRYVVERELRQVWRFYPRDRLRAWVTRGLLRWERRMRSADRPRSAVWAQRWAARAWGGAERLRSLASHHASVRRWRRSARPDVADLLRHLGRNLDWLTGDYVEGVAVPEGAKGFFHDRERNVVRGLFVGFDLIVTSDEVWCVEANLNTGFMPAPPEDAFAPEVDEVNGVLDAATELGMRRVVWVGGDRIAIPDWLVEVMNRSARDRALSLEVIEDPRLPRHEGTAALRAVRRAPTAPRELPEHTMVLRSRSYRLGPDRVISNKELMARGLGTILTEKGERGVRIPPMSPSPRAVMGERNESSEALPNLVYKYPQMDKGKGIHFLRARDPDHAVELARAIDRRRKQAPGLFQPFICSELLEGRRLYEVRAFVFVSPPIVRCCAVARREMVKPIPAVLGFGEAPDLSVFASNMSLGNVMKRTGAETARVREAAELAGRSLATLLARGFVSEKV